MIYYDCTLIPPVGDPLTVGTLNYTDTAPYGYTVELDVTPAPMSVDVTELVQATGDIVVGGRRRSRTVTLSGAVVARTVSELSTLWSRLVQVCGDWDGRPLTIAYTDGTVVRELAVVPTGKIRTEQVAACRYTFEFEFRAATPIAYDTNTNTHTLTVGGTTTITTAGDSTVGATYTLTGPTSGTTTAVRIANTTTGQWLQVSGITFGASAVLDIDATPGAETVELDGVGIYGKVTTGSRWPLLAPGDNHVQVTVTGGTGVTASCVWADGWVS